MRTRKYGIDGCKHRYDETRITKIEGKKNTSLLKNRCSKLQSRYHDKKCIFPKEIHKTCPVAN